MRDIKGLYGSLVTGDWPATVAKNASGPTASDGTPFTKDLIDDFMFGPFKAIMYSAGITPNGVAEDYNASQVLDAIRASIRGPGEIAMSMVNAATLATRRILPLAGQVIAIADYPELVTAVYVGDANNATYPGFYKTSDAGGSTRDTAGSYMVLPDARGLGIRGVGSNSKILKANGGAYSGGTTVAELLTDLMQGHIMYSGIPDTGSNNAQIYGGTTEDVPGSATQVYQRATATIGNQGKTSAPKPDNTNGTPRVGSETRMATMATQVCITY